MLGYESIKMQQSSRPVDREARRKKIAKLAEGPNNAQNAFTKFAAIEPEFAQVSSAIVAARFGPYAAGSKCDYDCGFMEWQWSFSYDPRPNFPFSETMSQMDCAGTFATYFEPITAMVTNYAYVNSQLAAQINVISQIDTTIINQGFPPTPEQTVQLQQAFDIANDIVANAQALNSQLITTMSNFETYYKGYDGILQSQLALVQTQVEGVFTSSRDSFIADAKCGTDTITSSFAALKAAFQASVAAVIPFFQQADAVYSAAIQSTTAIIGNLVVIQSYNQSTIDDLQKAAALDPTNIMRRVELMNAGTSFKEGMDYAVQNLSTSTG